MKVKLRSIIISMLLVISIAVAVGFCWDGRPNREPKYRVGQVVDMRFGKHQGMVMEVGPGKDTYTYTVKFYYNSRTNPEEIRVLKEFELKRKGGN